MKGWVTLHRQIEENPLWFSEPFTKAQAWIDLILNANHSDGHFFVRGVKVTVKRGQIGWSEVTMSKRWKWSRDKVRRFLSYLEDECQTRQQKIDKITTIITIINYSKFQDKTTEKQQKNNRQDTNNNVNNVNNVISEQSSQITSKDMAWNTKSDDYEEGVVDFDSGELKQEKKPNTRKYPNAPIIRKLFLEILGTNPAHWNKNVTVLQSCENLFTERGVEKVRNALEFYKEHQGKEFCPIINSPTDLDRKYANLSQYKNSL